ncbi:hypothetical protein [Georgenia thermotolerans]|uniref:hypothetical protein n=1 Tax=Georgenia thermotolerans TaxID=527326 RepID=UPI001265107A|nr:hypothetical protein [Georgenia thermotolerans]
MYRRIVRGLAAVGLGVAALGAVCGALAPAASAAPAAPPAAASAQRPADSPSRDSTDHPKKNPLDTGHGHEPRFKDWWDYL